MIALKQLGSRTHCQTSLLSQRVLGNVFYMCITITDSADIRARDEFYYINCKCIHMYLHSLCVYIIIVYIEHTVLWYITNYVIREYDSTLCKDGSEKNGHPYI